MQLNDCRQETCIDIRIAESVPYLVVLVAAVPDPRSQSNQNKKEEEKKICCLTFFVAIKSVVLLFCSHKISKLKKIFLKVQKKIRIRIRILIFFNLKNFY